MWFTFKQIYLEDLLLHSIHDLNQGAYTFYSETGEFKNRFVLRFNNNIETYSKEKTPENQAVFVQKITTGIAVRSASSPIKQVEIYDLLGRTLHTQKTTAQECVVLLEIPSQVVLVKTALQDGTTSTSKILY
jgi:hypothetical protein